MIFLVGGNGSFSATMTQPEYSQTPFQGQVWEDIHSLENWILKLSLLQFFDLNLQFILNIKYSLQRVLDFTHAKEGSKHELRKVGTSQLHEYSKGRADASYLFRCRRGTQTSPTCSDPEGSE